MRGFCLMLFRFCPAAWVGAATLFVIVTIGIARSPNIESDTTMQLTTVLFPIYYTMEFSLLGLALLAGFGGLTHGELGPIRSFIGMLLIGIALAGAVGDYIWIYRPLAEMIQNKTLTEDFRALHEASKHINMTIVSVVFISAAVVNWPGRARKRD